MWLGVGINEFGTAVYFVDSTGLCSSANAAGLRIIRVSCPKTRVLIFYQVLGIFWKIELVLNWALDD